MGLGPAADHSSAVGSESIHRAVASNGGQGSESQPSDWANVLENIDGSSRANKISEDAWVEMKNDETEESTRGSAVDIVCVHRSDGSLACSNFAVKFPTSSTPRLYDSMASMASRWRRSYSQATRRRRIIQQRRTNFSDDEANDDDENDTEENDDEARWRIEPTVEIQINGRRIPAIMRLGQDGYCRFAAPAWRTRAKRPVGAATGYEEIPNLPSDDELAAMDLLPGRNTIRFETVKRGTRFLAEARIFLWQQNDAVVICDIDGTVTRTDIRGFVDSVVNETPTNAHAGVCDFMDQIASRARILYLTSRPLVLADATRFFLDNLKQSAMATGRGIAPRPVRMPEGPLIMARSNLTLALYHELVLKNPHEFKAWALHDVLATFAPSGREEKTFDMPFKAAFGNKDTDCRAYQAGGIPNHAIFIIGTDSRLRLPYLHLHATSERFQDALKNDDFDQLNNLSLHPGVPVSHEEESFSSLDYLNCPIFDGYADPHLRHRVFQILGAAPIPRPLLRPRSIRATRV